MVSDRARPARIATFLLMIIAYAACEVASQPDGKPREFGIVSGIVILGIALVANALLRPPLRSTYPPSYITLPFAAVLILPLLLEDWFREHTDHGYPLEMQLIHGFRCFGLLLTGLCIWQRCRRLAGVVALFLALFVSAMGDQPSIPYFLLAYALIGSIWLVTEYHASESGELAGTKGELVNRVPLRLPRREALVFGGLLLLTAGILLASPKQTMFKLEEWIGSSGGSGDVDPFARYGTGDGPEETAGENAIAAGMVESNQLIEDNKDALIDAVSDMYGRPHRPPRDPERMVAAGVLQVIENHGKLPDNRRPNRDFSTTRSKPKKSGKPDSRTARALYEVQGRTPLHIRAVVYDQYDHPNRQIPTTILSVTGGMFQLPLLREPMRWRAVKDTRSRTLDLRGNDWMVLSHYRETEWYSKDDHHILKIADGKEGLLPTPPLLSAVRIHRVDKPDYYTWTNDGILRLRGRSKIPPGIVIHTESRTLDPERLPENAFPTTGPNGVSPPVYGTIPESLREPLTALAQDWAGNAPRGWQQVEAIVQRLRTNYTLDPSAIAPVDHPTPVLWFLSESHRGPDYLFATAAAMLLRALDYPTRVCLGYYVSPDAYDPETDHTPVKKTDLHMWAEIQLRDGHWLVIEATPGYSVLPPLHSWQEELLEGFTHMIAWMSRNIVSVVLGLLLIMYGIFQRKRLLDRLWTLLWSMAPGTDWRQRTLRTLWLIEKRCALLGKSRSTSQTVSKWAEELDISRPVAPTLRAFTRLVEHAAYAPNLPAPLPESEVIQLCRNVAQICSYPSLLDAVQRNPS